MAKHRTKEQKRKAAEQRQLQSDPTTVAEVEQALPTLKETLSKTTLQWSGGRSSSVAHNPVSPGVIGANKLFFGFDPKWIYQDLRKTAWVSCLIVGILVFVYIISR